MTAKTAELFLGSESSSTSLDVSVTPDVPVAIASTETFSSVIDRKALPQSTSGGFPQDPTMSNSRTFMHPELKPPIEEMFTTISPHALLDGVQRGASNASTPLNPLRARLLLMARLHQAIGERP